MGGCTAIGCRALLRYPDIRFDVSQKWLEAVLMSVYADFLARVRGAG